jgi:tRNA nucleotidyltransferase (CCA-adding enzyme)
VLSTTNLARFQHYARDLLTDPRDAAFDFASPTPLSTTDVRTEIDRRGTIPVAVRFDAPDLVADQLYPQLERSRRGVADALDRRGFDSLRSVAFADTSAVLFVELAVAERPRIERHEGPPVSAREHATAFHEKYADTDCYGPFIDGGRYVVERERTFTTPQKFLESDALFDVALGADIKRALATDYTVLVGDETAHLADEFGAELARYVSPRP